MISAYVGLPGSGKSYNVVEHVILPALKEGRVVVTNLPMHEAVVSDAIPDADLRHIELERIVDNPALIDELCPAGSVVVLDEAWRLWPAGNKVNNIPQEFKSFLAEHRHRVDEEGRSMQIVIVTQDLAQIAAFARQLVEQTLLHTQLGHIGAKGKFKVNIAHGAITGTVIPENRQLVTRLGSYKPEVFRFYKSHTMSKSGKDGADERAIDQRGNVWKRPGLLAMMVVAIACLAFGGTWAYRAVKDPGAAVGGAVGAPQSAPAKPVVVGSVAPPVAPPRARYRVGGWLTVEGGKSLVLLYDGASAAWLPFESYCRHARGGVVTCSYNGRQFASNDFPL
jgi:zona occludens toxin